jgi:hypothetical protein
MRTLVLGLAAAIGMGGAAGAETPNVALMAPIHQFIDSFDKGDQKAAMGAFAPGPQTIIDEVPPHVWIGPNAVQAWGKDLGAHDKAAGISDQAVILGEPTRQVDSGATGYVIVSVVYTYKEKGVATHEPAQMAYALRKGAKGWLITGWTWVGTTPQPDAAPAK